MESAIIPAWKIKAKFAGLPLSRKGLGNWNGEERRARPRGDTEAWTWREPEGAPRTFGRRPVRPFATVYG